MDDRLILFAALEQEVDNILFDSRSEALKNVGKALKNRISGRLGRRGWSNTISQKGLIKPVSRTRPKTRT